MSPRRFLRRGADPDPSSAATAAVAAPDASALARMRERGWALPPPLARDDVVPTWTRIGVVDGARAGRVDDRGLVTPIPTPDRPSVDWWVGAEDRWYVPARERGVTHRRVDGAPVVETTLRVPGGEVVHRAFGARGSAYPGGDDWVVVEVENRSALPVALAWVVRPYTSAGPTAGGPVSLAQALPSVPNGPQVLRAPHPVGLLPRPPSRWAAGADGGDDPVHQVTSGDALSTPVPGPEVEDLPEGSVALLVPLPHTATARLALFGSPVEDADLEGVEVAWPDHLPSAEAVARGWTTLAERGPRVELPDPVLAEAVAAARRSLPLVHRLHRERAASDQEQPPATHLVTSGDGGQEPDRTAAGERMELLAALAWWGEGDVVDRALIDWPAGQRRGGGFGSPEATAQALRALSAHALASGDVGPGAAWLPEVGGAVEALGRWARRPPEGTDLRVLAEGLDAAAVLLAGLGQPEAAERVAVHAAEVGAAVLPWSPSSVDAGPSATPRAVAAAAVAATRAGAPATEVWALLRQASATSTWSDPERWVGDDGLVSVRLLDAVSRLLVRDLPSGPALVPWMPPEWWGLGWEVHRAPTRWGHLSYAVRWHSGRPALLWEMGDPVDGVRGEAELTAPGLDPTWRGAGRTGEALLMPVPPPEGAAVGSPGGGASSRGVAVAAPPRSVWRPEDAGPDAPDQGTGGVASPDDPGGEDPRHDGPDGGSFS
ncbi:MAG: hypothetical protein ACR2JF_08445 [Iamia sp.]